MFQPASMSKEVEMRHGSILCLPQFHTERNQEYVHIAMVACNRKVGEAIVHLKAITLITNSYIHFHIFTDATHLLNQIKDEFEGWPAWKEGWMKFTLSLAHYPSMANSKIWRNMFARCATFRLFLGSVLENVDSVIYINADVLLLQPPEELWNHFKYFTGSQISGMNMDECAKNGRSCKKPNTCSYKCWSRIPFYGPYALNSGVMLMNLTRMRKLNWEHRLVSIYNEYRQFIAWGDQDILNIYFHQFNHKLYDLPCTWNYRTDFCRHGELLCEDALLNGISALHGIRRVFGNWDQPEFHLVHEVFKKFKFGDDFQEKVVNIIYRNFSKYKRTRCGKMRDALIKHIQ